MYKGLFQTAIGEWCSGRRKYGGLDYYEGQNADCLAATHFAYCPGTNLIGVGGTAKTFTPTPAGSVWHTYAYAMRLQQDPR